jgi:hypothetical protein
VTTLDIIRKQVKALERRFESKLTINSDLKRTLVSFQANKREAEYRWFKYKEGFSTSLIRHILGTLGISSGRLLDPFAGSGSALFTASSHGLDAVGIELLPIGAEIIETRLLVSGPKRKSIEAGVKRWRHERPWMKEKQPAAFSHLRITSGAFPSDTQRQLGCYVSSLERETDADVRRVLRFAALSVLEEISYTRKDGQYLRWDYRSGRRQGARPFDKGPIRAFDVAILDKLTEIYVDLGNTDLFGRPKESRIGSIELFKGSSLKILPQFESATFDCLITSPPYCNRYDYTRTYALELAMLGIGEEELRELRQELMSCTVENRDKPYLKSLFSPDLYERALWAFDSQAELHTILRYLDERKDSRELNNFGIPRMVRNYFLEISLIIFECARVLKLGAPLIMVNDNVRYEGANIPVDLILSSIAQEAGFTIEVIWVLPNGKGNSSQQMGAHGREETRKCVYVWRRSKDVQAIQSDRRADGVPLDLPRTIDYRQ